MRNIFLSDPDANSNIFGLHDYYGKALSIEYHLEDCSELDEVSKVHGNIEFLKAPYLNDHPKVVETFCDRVIDVIDGDINMNCQLCKYREQVLGFEDEVDWLKKVTITMLKGVVNRTMITPMITPMTILTIIPTRMRTIH